MAALEVITPDEVLDALRMWHGGDSGEWPLAHLRLALKVMHQEDVYRSLAEAGPAAQNRAVLNAGLQMLQGSDSEAHDLLRERFENRRDVISVANSLNIAESTLLYRQRMAVKQLTDILSQLEEEASREWREKILSRLDLPSYHELVGIQEPRASLIQALMSKEAHFIVAVDGLGGIGKTALVDRVVRDLIQTTRFEEIGWVTAKQTHLSTLGRLQVESSRPALTFPMLVDALVRQFELPESGVHSQLQSQRQVKRYLRERTCLIVIDNLETVADYHTLLPELRQWQRPTKFLLTSRRRLLDEPDVFSVSLQELSQEAAFQLIRLEARRAGFADLVDAGQEQLAQIYQAVGGNPLALKLLIGQLRFYSLPEVLARFSAGSQTAGDGSIFDYIYQEFWELLGDESRQTLLALTQTGESGFTLSHLAAVSDLEELVLVSCLQELILLSLVDIGGTLAERRYRLHRLTEAFLLRTFSGGGSG